MIFDTMILILISAGLATILMWGYSRIESKSEDQIDTILSELIQENKNRKKREKK